MKIEYASTSAASGVQSLMYVGEVGDDEVVSVVKTAALIGLGAWLGAKVLGAAKKAIWIGLLTGGIVLAKNS